MATFRINIQHLINAKNPMCLNSFRIESVQSNGLNREHLL